MITKSNISEKEIQNFLVKHPEILTSLGYCSAKPHICLRMPDCNNLIPDFILELPGGRGFDILDLKLPQAQVAAAV